MTKKNLFRLIGYPGNGNTETAFRRLIKSLNELTFPFRAATTS